MVNTKKKTAHNNQAESIVFGGGDMGDRIREVDWSKTPLGAIDTWPLELRLALNICLASSYPKAVYWGEKLWIFYNDAFKTILGDKHPWALGKPAQEVWTDIWEVVEPQFKDVFTKGEPVWSNNQLLPMMRHGFIEETYFDYTFTPIRNEAGEIKGILNTGVEITYRVLHERRISVLNELAQLPSTDVCPTEISTKAIEIIKRTQLDIPFCMIYLLSEDKHLATLAAIAGLKPDTELSSRTVNLQKEKQWSLNNVLKTLQPLHITNLFKRFGSIVLEPWTEPCSEAYIMPLRSEKQKAHGFIIAGVSPRRQLDSQYSQFLEAVAQHVATAMTNAEAYRVEKEQAQALQENEERLRLALSAGNIGVWDWNIAEDKLEWTDRVYEMHGVTKDTFEVTFENFRNLIHPDYRNLTKKAITDTLEKDKPFDIQFKVLTPTGEERWIATSATLVRDKQRRPIRMLGATSDITQQKLLDQNKNDFVSIASHELKTPVTSLKGFTQFLKSQAEKKGDEKSAVLLGKMDAQINKLTDLISDLLDVTKIEAGKLSFTKANFDFDELVTETIESMQLTTEKHTIILEGKKTNAVVFGDRDRIGQVLINFLSNAIKYSPDADKVVLCVKSLTNTVEICVQDFGVGIPKSKLGHIFERFYRVSEKNAHTFPGLGLGLYISSEIIKRSGGKIWVESQKDEGSKFCFTLPIIKK